MEHYMLISDAAKEVCVESHVLRYWEEELKLPIKRNELGHRYYTTEDIERFKQIKRMKEKGIQLKAIRMILKNGNLNVLTENEAAEERVIKPLTGSTQGNATSFVAEPDMIVSSMGIDIVNTRNAEMENTVVSKDEKAKRLQWLLRQLIRETLQENNQELCQEIKNSVVKELDYQFRKLEEREEERDIQRIKRDEAYYKKMDELLRKKSKVRVSSKKKENIGREKSTDMFEAEKKGKKKRHSIF